MIILEGPDGAGKSSLARRLSHDTGIPIHERASTSVGGPVANLWGWVCQDLGSWDTQPLAIYDRHPLISEYIYGAVIRGTIPQGFLMQTARGQLQRMASQALIVFCMPPLEEVLVNIENEGLPQMVGVRGNMKALYYSYAARRASWPGWAVDYDYTMEEGKGSYDAVRRAVRLHTATFRRIK